VDRTACVDLPAFPLQLLLKREADWRERPAAVVDSDRPQGRILWLNEAARARRIRAGMSYAAALSLAGDLRAGVVPEQEIEREVSRLARRLRGGDPLARRVKLTKGDFAAALVLGLWRGR